MAMKPIGDEGLFFGGLVIIFGLNAGLFVYNGTPALGNPPIFSVTTATTDPFGNAVTPASINASTLGLLISLIQAQSGIFNPGPFLLYGNPGATLTPFTATGTFTPTANGTVQVYFIGQGAAGTATTGGGAGESALDTAGVTNATPYTITIDAVSTRATFDAGKTVTAHAATGRLGATGSTNATHFNGGNGATSNASNTGAGGGAASAVGPGGNASGTTPGKGGAAAFVYQAGGNGGGPGVAGHAPGGGGGSGAAGGAGYALVVFTPATGNALLDSIAQAAGTDPIDGGTYIAGTANYNPTFSTWAALQNGALVVQAGGKTSQLQASSAPAGFPIVTGAPDANSYDISHVTDVSFTSVGASTVDVTIMTHAVGIGTYKWRAWILYHSSAAAGNPNLGLTLPANSANHASVTFFPNGAVTPVSGGLGTAADVAGPTYQGASTQYLVAEGKVTTTAAGNLIIKGHTSAAADTWVIDDADLTIMPVVAT